MDYIAPIVFLAILGYVINKMTDGGVVRVAKAIKRKMG